MNTIAIDDEVMRILATNAKPFVDTPNLVLRRLLGVDSDSATKITATSRNHEGSSRATGIGSTAVGKAKKADLRTLISEGVLQEGQTLYLVDYRRDRVRSKEDGREVSATIEGGSLKTPSKSGSMSWLAGQYLKLAGFKADFVRGPSHWATAEGKTISDLWLARP